MQIPPDAEFQVFGEISFDLVIPDRGLDHIEGCYRLEAADWRVFYFTHRTRGRWHEGEPIIRPEARFSSGILGVDAVYPTQIVLNKPGVKALLSEILGGVEWTEVLGPDSLTLK